MANIAKKKRMRITLKDLGTVKGRVVIVVSVVVILLIGAFFFSGPAPSPIPRSISSKVSFPVYYPDPGRLPNGYSLNFASTEVVNPGVVIMFVGYGKQSQYIVMSEEAMPSSSTISNFLTSNIPLNTSFNTPFGSGVIGAYNDGKELRTVISLPINNGPWIIATAPKSINSSQFENILSSLIKN